jgi:hypothetical protein
MYDFTSLDKTLGYLEKVRLGETCHFYWPRGVVTLCLKDKRYQKPLWVAEVPVCAECSAKLVETVLKAREQRAA